MPAGPLIVFSCLLGRLSLTVCVCACRVVPRSQNDITDVLSDLTFTAESDFFGRKELQVCGARCSAEPINPQCSAVHCSGVH